MNGTGLISMSDRKIKIEKPSHRSEQSPEIAKEVQKYLRLIPQTPEPNMGRVMEIKEEIKKGTYLQPEMIDVAAIKIANRLLNGER